MAIPRKKITPATFVPVEPEVESLPEQAQVEEIITSEPLDIALSVEVPEVEVVEPVVPSQVSEFVMVAATKTDQWHPFQMIRLPHQIPVPVKLDGWVRCQLQAKILRLVE